MPLKLRFWFQKTSIELMWDSLAGLESGGINFPYQDEWSPNIYVLRSVSILAAKVLFLKNFSNLPRCIGGEKKIFVY